MPTTEVERSAVETVDPPIETIDIAEFDLHPPPVRARLLFRHHLVDQISGDDADVILITAPSGYGKTTILGQWAGTNNAPLAWLTLRPEDKDARSLLVHLTRAIGQISNHTAEEAAVVRFMDAKSLATRGATLLAAWMSRITSPAVIVIDNAHLLRSAESNAVIAELVRQLEGSHKVVLASRTTLKLRLAELRSHGRLLELSERDLALTAGEVRRLMTDLGDEQTIDDVMEVTQGWPAAVSLLSVAIRAGSYADSASMRGGDDRLLGDFVRSEVLPGLSKGRRTFLTTMAPLERISAPLCDYISGSKRSRALIEEIEASTHLVSPVEPSGSWYVINRVVRDALRSELARQDPELLVSVHTRAAAWFEENNMAEEALRHAQSVGNMDAVARMMERIVKERYATGRARDTLAWMKWLQTEASLEKYPLVAAMGALALAQEGEALDAEKWMDAALRGPKHEETPPVVWIVKALACKTGVAGMIEDVEKARSALPPGSEWAPAALLTAGLALTWNGQPVDAEAMYIEAAEIGERNGSYPAVSLALAERAISAVESSDWALAAVLSGKALGMIAEYGLDGYLTSGLGFVAAARCARHDNEIARARTLLASAEAIRPRMSSAIPGIAVQTLLEMGRAHLELSDVVGARAHLRQASDLIAQRPDLGVLPDEIQALHESMRNIGPGTIGPSALTKAELRLLPFLATNLSFPQIGEQLFISRHTVKTQAMSIYRKLGTSSRSDAVAKALEIGLLTR